MEFVGLDEFQKDLLSLAQDKLPRETYKHMRKVGSKNAVQIRKVARAKVDKKTGMYHKRFKRGKVFRDDDGTYVVRVFNSSPHAHLIEYGHRLVRGGQEVGFVPGKNVISEGSKNFDDSQQFEKMTAEWLDKMLDEQGL